MRTWLFDAVIGSVVLGSVGLTMFLAHPKSRCGEGPTVSDVSGAGEKLRARYRVTTDGLSWRVEEKRATTLRAVFLDKYLAWRDAWYEYANSPPRRYKSREEAQAVIDEWVEAYWRGLLPWKPARSVTSSTSRRQ